MRSSVEIEMKFIPKTKRQNGKISFLQRLSEREDVWIRRRVWDLASLASIIVKGLRRKEWTIKLPFNINVLSTYNVITRLTDFIAWT